MIRRTQSFNCFCRRIQPEEMRVGFLFGGKINSVGPPADEPWIFVERFRQNLRGTAFRGHHSDLYIRVVEESRSRGGLERNLSSIGRDSLWPEAKTNSTR